MNPTAIYSKSGKGVQEASGKTSLLKRPDRAVLSAIDGRANLADVAAKVGKSFDAAFQALITQLDKDGFIREVSAGAAAAAPKPAAMPAKPGAKPPAKAADAGADLDFSSLGGAPSRPAAPPSRPAAPPPKPAAPQPTFAQLDFSTLGTTPKAAVPKPAATPAAAPQAAKEQQSALAKAREEAEARAAAERERMKAEAEAKTRGEMEAKMRAEAEKKIKEEASAEAEAKVKAARDAALKAAEAKLKVEAEAKAKIDAERKAREETERRLEEERKAREQAERKAKEEAERARKEAEEKARREAEELRQRLEAERKAREEAERKAKEEAERVRRELEQERKRLEAERKREEEERAERKKREEEEAAARRRQREEEDRKAEEERAAKRKQREEEDAAHEAELQAKREARRKEREAADAKPNKEEPNKEEPKKEQPKKEQSFGDSLLADLDSFSNRDEEERKQREEGERKAKADAEQRRREEAEREAERQREEQEARRRKDEEGRRAREDEERREQEEERRKRDAEDIRRKAAAATAAAMAKEGKPARAEEDIPISDDDLDMNEVKREQAAIARTQAKEKEKDQERERAAVKAEKRAEDSPRLRKPVKWGRMIGTTLIVLVVVGLVAVHVMPVPVADYERAATEALGRPVKIGDAKYWLLTGPQVRFSNVQVGEARIAQVAASLSPGSLFGDRKEFTRVELDGLALPQAALAEALFATVKADNLTIERIVVKNLELPGPAVMPKNLQADVQLDGKGALRAAIVHGPDGLVAKIVPKEGAIEFDVLAAGFTLPIAPQITLSKFGMKGSATPRGMKVDEWGGAIFNGGISGTANIRWGSTWSVDGVVTVRSINAAVFAPALLSNGTAEGTGRFAMNGADPAKLATSGRLDGNFTVTQGTLGSYDLAKAIQTGGKQAAGTTSFTEMTGQAVYDRGAVSLRNVAIGAGALNAGASADIATSGALSGRIVADVKNASRSQQAIIVLGGTVKEPQVR